MNVVAITLGCSWTLIGLVVIAVAIPLARGRVGPNGLYGIRFRESFQSDEAWFAINRYGGRRLFVWAIPLVLVGIGCFFFPLHAHPALTLVAALAPLVFLFIPHLKHGASRGSTEPGHNRP
jgi:hypothetical protein